jgi:hypothetical protein
VLQAGRVFDVTDNDSDLGLQFSRVNVIRNGVKVGTATGKKNAQPAVGRLDFHVIDGCALSG